MTVRRWGIWLAPLVLVLAATGLTTPATSAPLQSSAATAEAGRRWLERGTGQWSVTALGDSTWRIAWRSPGRLPVSSDRPRIVQDGTELGATTLAGDGRTVEVVVRSEQRPAPAALDVVLSGDRLDVAGDDVVAAAGGFAVEQSLLPDDPATPGPYSVVTSDYELDPLKVAGLPVPVEMVGHVVEPGPGETTGPRPLVLFLHGRHSYCYIPGKDRYGDEWPCSGKWKEIPGQLGYDYAQRLLASQGFATVSVRVNGINAQDWQLNDGGATARATVVQAHLDHWATIAAEHQVDLDRVVLVGHSRGGEGVNRAAITTPLSAPYRIAGQVLLAPTDFGSQTGPYVPTVTVLPYCDGDVYDLQGQRFTDVGRDLAPGDQAFRSSVLVMGANHNYFNTEWTPGLAQAPAWDDWGGDATALCGQDNPDRLTPTEQQDAGKAVIAAAVRLFTRDEEQFLPLLDGSGATVASVGDGVLLSHAVGGGRQVRRPGIDAGRSLPDGAETSLCRPLSGSGQPRDCDPTSRGLGVGPHWASRWFPGLRAQELDLRWSAAGQSGGLAFDTPLDVTGKRVELRVVTDPTYGASSVDVRLTDGAGHSATLTPAADGTLAPLPGSRYVRKLWARTLVVDPAGAAGVDLTDVVQVDLVGRTDSGHVWLLDVAAAGTDLASVPGQRLPYVELGNARVLEGDASGTTVAHLPFRVVGTLTRPATFRVQVVGDRTLSGRGTYDVDLAAGQQSGSIRIGYAADTSYDPGRVVFANAWGVSGVGTGQWVGQLRIKDDDAPPTPTLRAPTSVTEGGAAIWRLRLSESVSQHTYAQVRIVRGPHRRPALRVGDVPDRWLQEHYVEAEATTPLQRAGVWLDGSLRPGSRQLTFRIPTRSDSLREGTELVTLRVKYLGQRVERTIRVLDGTR